MNLIKNSDKRFIIAVPTNILKEEVYQRLKFAGVEGVVKTASISTLEQAKDEVGQRVKEFNSLGAYNDLVEYLKKKAKDDKEYLLDYIKPLEQYGKTLRLYSAPSGEVWGMIGLKLYLNSTYGFSYLTSILILKELESYNLCYRIIETFKIKAYKETCS